MKFINCGAVALAALLAAACESGVQTASADQAESAAASDGVCAIVAAGDADAPRLRSVAAADAIARSQAWMSANAGRDGVMTTESGLQYSVLESGDPAGATPSTGQWVCVHYRGILVDGEEFDSSCGRGAPAAFPSDRLIPGWVEALQMMREGDVWELHIPADLAYGADGAGDLIRPHEALVFRVAMLRLLDGPVADGVDCSQ